MNIQIQTSDLDATDAIRDFVLEKFGHLTKVVNDPDALCTVTLKRVTNHQKQGEVYKVLVHLRTVKSVFQIEEISEDLYAGVDMAKDSTERAVITNSKKQRTLWRRAAAQFKKLLRK